MQAWMIQIPFSGLLYKSWIQKKSMEAHLLTEKANQALIPKRFTMKIISVALEISEERKILIEGTVNDNQGTK